MPIILDTQEAEIRRITAHTNSLQDPIWKNPSQKRAGRVAQGVGPEFKPQSTNKTKQKKGTIFNQLLIL
jgi:hypothetical protein